jgi:hypothetical protein
VRAAPGAGGAAVGNAMHAISIHDVASDTVHQFAPTYRNYVLYSDKHDDDSKPDEAQAPKRTFRAKTFVPVEAVRHRVTLILHGAGPLRTPTHACC